PDGTYAHGLDEIRAATAPIISLRPHMTSVAYKTLRSNELALTHASWDLGGGRTCHLWKDRIRGRRYACIRRSPCTGALSGSGSSVTPERSPAATCSNTAAGSAASRIPMTGAAPYRDHPGQPRRRRPVAPRHTHPGEE